MVNLEKKENQLNHLLEVITDSNYWSNDSFRVLNNEAGMGKSEGTYKAISQLALKQEDIKIIYVQKFANKISADNDAIFLQETVNKINKLADNKEIAGYISNNNIREHKHILSSKNIICITHRKYMNLCKTAKENFITKADILIIDEFLDLYEEYKINEAELVKLNGINLLDEEFKKQIRSLNKYILDLIKTNDEKYSKEIHIVNLQKLDIKKHITTLEKICKLAKKDLSSYHYIHDIACNVLELFSHSSIYFNKSFYTFNSHINYIMARQCNIILDANAGFDKRYKLRPNTFKLDSQSKVFDYTDSKMIRYNISTTKTALNNYINIVDDISNYSTGHRLGFKNWDTLIVTDLQRENIYSPDVKECIETFDNICLAHFGNIIGKNQWRKFQTIWIAKTPYMSFYQYILMYMFYSQENLNGNTSCEIGCSKGCKYVKFKNKDFDKFKNSLVLGEMYQACKRIARNGESCTMNILIDNDDIFELLVNEFKNIQISYKSDLNVKIRSPEEEKKKPGKKPTKTEERLKIAIDYINKAKEEGKDRITKAELIKILDIQKTKLSPLLKKVTDIKFTIGTNKDQAYILL